MFKKLKLLFIAQLLNITIPFLYTIMLLNKSSIGKFGQIELVFILTVMFSIGINFSFSSSFIILNKGKKISSEKKNRVFTNIIILRFFLFVLYSIVLKFVFKLNDNFSVQHIDVAFVYLFGSIFELGWLYLATDRYHFYIVGVLMPKNLLITTLLYFLDDKITDYYLLVHASSVLLINLIAVYKEKIRIIYKMISYKYIIGVLKKTLAISLTDQFILLYNYLDVYLISILLSAEHLGIYVLVRKIIKSFLALISQFPQFFLKYSIGINKYKKNFLYITFSMSFLFFITYNIIDKYVFLTIFNLSGELLINTSTILSFVLIFGPIQNTFMYTYILPISRIYFLKVIIISTFIYFGIFYLLSRLNYINLYSVSFLRILIDILIILIAYIIYKGYGLKKDI